MMSDVIVVGGGIAGLTASAYLALAGLNPLLLEKGDKCGGLISSFEREGFLYDGGIRATENSGILFPMLKQIGLDVEFIKNEISIGVEDKVIRIKSQENINEYQELLNSLYPDSIGEISEIVAQIKKIMQYMEVQYGIDNPAFLDMRENLGYFVKKILPWMVKYVITVPKITRLNMPVNRFLENFTKNQALMDNITQHFFRETPAYFALSYLKIYLDYYYPVGGTGVIPEKLSSFIQKHEGTIKTNTLVTEIDPVKKVLADSEGNKYSYNQVIWAADLNSLYKLVDAEIFDNSKTKKSIIKRKQELEGKMGNDSILTVYLASNKEPSYFSGKSTGHFFYTPSRRGETSGGPIPVDSGRVEIQNWLSRFAGLATYEISIPVLRDPSLAPAGKTGLVISTLFDYHLAKQFQDQGWYDEFTFLWEELLLETLDGSIYPGFKDSIIHRFSSTPLTIEKRTGNTHGAITGWAFTNDPMPAENRLPRIYSSTETPVPDIVQAGHWTYSPSGFPISILTGKLAADRVINKLKKK
jgi:phytoene dehydrogenase-like protein